MENTPRPQPPVYEGNPLISIFWGTGGIWVCSWSLFEFPHSLVVGTKWAPTYFPQMVMDNASVVIKSHGTRTKIPRLKNTQNYISFPIWLLFSVSMAKITASLIDHNVWNNGAQDYGPNVSRRVVPQVLLFHAHQKSAHEIIQTHGNSALRFSNSNFIRFLLFLVWDLEFLQFVFFPEVLLSWYIQKIS